MDEHLPEEDRSGDLCTSCGLCCNGVLFDWVPVAEEEREHVVELGLDVREEQGKLRFAQPCTMFDGRLCAVYAARPDKCRRFRCELLKKVDSNEVPLSEAFERVAEAKALLGQVEPLLQPESGSVGKQWAALFREWQSRPPEQRADDRQARLMLYMTLLNRLLDRHFRNEKQRRVMEE